MALQISKIIPYFIAGWVPGGRRLCVLCDRRVHRFMPYRNGWAGVPRLICLLDVIGSDPEQFECPRCGGHDRERHLLMYLRELEILPWLAGKAVLHFAPEKRLSRILAGLGMMRYVRCDLYPEREGIERVDMMDISFPDNTFDLVIANHVLEHVDDVERAIAELHRVVRSGGFAVLQTPYSQILQGTWEDRGIVDPAARLQAYGQEDHVRLFGIDIFDRFTRSGFVSSVCTHGQVLEQYDPVRHGVNPREPFFLFRKP